MREILQSVSTVEKTLDFWIDGTCQLELTLKNVYGPLGNGRGG